MPVYYSIVIQVAVVKGNRELLIFMIVVTVTLESLDCFDCFSIVLIRGRTLLPLDPPDGRLSTVLILENSRNRREKLISRSKASASIRPDLISIPHYNIALPLVERDTFLVFLSKKSASFVNKLFVAVFTVLRNFGRHWRRR